MLSAVTCGTLITPARQIEQAVLRLEGGRVRAVETSAGPIPKGADVLDASGALVIPGLVDVQVNGALGYSFQAEDAPHFGEVLRYHLTAGTTTLLPTLITAPEDTLAAGLQYVRQHAGGQPHDEARIVGIHLEGPFLNPEKSGAHDPAALRLPDLPMMLRLAAAAGGMLKIVTLAPELPGAEALIRRLAEMGITVSAGHTAAAYADLRTAAGAGLRMVTHAGNASDWPHRAMGSLGFLSSEPGLVGTLMADERLSGGVILDGFHFHPALLKPLLKIKGPDGLFLVSDASTVAGCPPGEYVGGGMVVTIHPQGFATSGRGGGWLAGSTITLLEAVQRAVRLAGLPLQTAVRMASLGPCRAANLPGDLGHLEPGARADLLVLNPDLSIRHVVKDGELLPF